MEIKTCEDYVVTRVMQLENECEEYKNTIVNLTHENAVLTNGLKDIKRIINPRICKSSPYKYIDVDAPWDYQDGYARLCDIFNLKYEEEEEENG